LAGRAAVERGRGLGGAADSVASARGLTSLAPAPNRQWVTDLTYVRTHSKWVYVALIVDLFSRRNQPVVATPR